MEVFLESGVCSTTQNKLIKVQVLHQSVSRSEASGRSPDEAPEHTGGITSLSDAITPVVSEILGRLRLHTLSSPRPEKTQSSDCWKLIILSQRLIRADLG